MKQNLRNFVRIFDNLCFSISIDRSKESKIIDTNHIIKYLKYEKFQKNKKISKLGILKSSFSLKIGSRQSVRSQVSINEESKIRNVDILK